MGFTISPFVAQCAQLGQFGSVLAVALLLGAAQPMQLLNLLIVAKISYSVWLVSAYGLF